MNDAQNPLLFPEGQEGGCSAKLPAKELETLLAGVDWGIHEEVLVGLSTGDDAGVYMLSDEEGLILTTDFFPPFCRDPFLYGEVACVNALSDVYAMGGRPLAALNITLFPTEGYAPSLLRRMLEGGAQAARRARVPIIGGHTIGNARPVYGMAVLGIVPPQRMVTNSALTDGMDLILTNPLGSGAATAAHRLGLDQWGVFEEALQTMLQLNDEASRLMRDFGVRAATDVTGFGLAGHAHKMAQASGVTVEIEVSQLRLFTGVRKLLQEGCIPGAAFRNAEYLEGHWAFHGDVRPWQRALLTDPQTSGGLLMGVVPEHTPRLLEALRQAGYPHAARIGRTTARSEVSLRIMGEGK